MRITKWKSIRAVTDSYGGVLWYCQGQANRCSYCVHIGADGKASTVVAAHGTELNEPNLADRLTQVLATATAAAEIDLRDPMNFIYTESWAKSVLKWEELEGRSYDPENIDDQVAVLTFSGELYRGGQITERPPVY